MNNLRFILGLILNRTLIVGPCFCGKTYLMLNKILLHEIENPDREIKINN